MGQELFHKFRDKLSKQKEVLKRLVDRTDDDGLKDYFAEKQKLEDLLFQEEIYWKQRAKTFWLAEGDANTKFFHANATARRKTNHITFLMDDNGERIENHEAMCEVVKNYYQEIFKGNPNNENVQLTNVERCVTNEQNENLVSEVSFEEFTLAIKQMHPDKASGPDDLNPAFFQQFWSILGKDIFLCCKDWLNLSSFPANLNDTNVVLIPKKENACYMKDLRPIALCNILYKILAKVLSNRLKAILPGLISENQSTFVPGRNIQDNVLIAFEIIHHMNKKKRGRDGEVALKLDISKAYDRVDWAYLRARMQGMGFCNKWIGWVMMCVTTVSYDFCFNGSSIGPITPSRGLRQGDPLSPYLFLFCVEGLSSSLSTAAAEGSIHGSQISLNAPAVTHLLFADDSFLFFRADTTETTAVKEVLVEYERLSGQSVNFQKSGVFYSAIVSQSKRDELCGILGVHTDLTEGK